MVSMGKLSFCYYDYLQELSSIFFFPLKKVSSQNKNKLAC